MTMARTKPKEHPRPKFDELAYWYMIDAMNNPMRASVGFQRLCTKAMNSALRDGEN
jgi:hypothetical protein